MSLLEGVPADSRMPRFTENWWRSYDSSAPPREPGCQLARRHLSVKASHHRRANHPVGCATLASKTWELAQHIWGTCHCKCKEQGGGNHQLLLRQQNTPSSEWLIFYTPQNRWRGVLGKSARGKQVTSTKYQGRRPLDEPVERKYSCTFFPTSILQATG